MKDRESQDRESQDAIFPEFDLQSLKINLEEIFIGFLCYHLSLYLFLCIIIA